MTSHNRTPLIDHLGLKFIEAHRIENTEKDRTSRFVNQRGNIYNRYLHNEHFPIVEKIFDITAALSVGW